MSAPSIEIVPMGDADEFYNAVAQVTTDLQPQALLDACLAIEAQLGRQRGEGRWLSRTIDLDLLLYADCELATERLSLPHPRIAERDFVAQPLFDVNPDLCVSGTPIRGILDALGSYELERIEEVLR